MKNTAQYWKTHGRGGQVRLVARWVGAELEEEPMRVFSDDAAVESARLRTMFKEGPMEDFGALVQSLHDVKETAHWGSVPLLVVDDGFSLAQGPVICRFLAESAGRVLPDVRTRARADEVAWAAEDVREAFFQACRVFGSKPQSKRRDDFAATWRSRYAPNFERALARNGTGFMAGSELSHGDVCAYDIVSCVTRELGIALDEWPLLAAWHARVDAELDSPFDDEDFMGGRAEYP